jgi:ribosome biogenesis GTPase
VPRSLACSLDGRGLDAIRRELAPRSTVVLLGSSGAGKSTLLNALAGEALAETGEVRADDQRGRHTTTRRQMYRLDTGALVVDTPGLRELQLLVEGDAIDAAFPEIEAAAEECRFRDCRHESEPGCAVLAAVESGAIDRGRYEGWRKLAKEAAFLRTKADHAAKDAERRRWKSIEMSVRSFRKQSSRG